MKNTVFALASVGMLGLGAIAAPAPVQAQASAVYVLGPAFEYWPAYYRYVPARRAAYAPDDAAAPYATRYVLFDDVYPPAIYGPRLRPVVRYGHDR